MGLLRPELETIEAASSVVYRLAGLRGSEGAEAGDDLGDGGG